MSKTNPESAVLDRSAEATARITEARRQEALIKNAALPPAGQNR